MTDPLLTDVDVSFDPSTGAERGGVDHTTPAEVEGMLALAVRAGSVLAATAPATREIWLSAVTGRVELMNAVHAGGLGGTYAGNPLACAAALGVFEAFADGTLVDNARQIEATARAILEPLLTDTSIVADVRGRGAMLAVEFADRETLVPRPELAKEIAARCHAQGLLVLVCGTYGNVIRLLPPLVIETALLADGLNVLCDVIQQVDAAARAASLETVAA